MNRMTTARRRELTVVLILAVLLGSGVFLGLSALLGSFLLSSLGVLAVFVLIGLVHYAFWGRALAERTAAPTAVPTAPPPWENRARP